MKTIVSKFYNPFRGLNIKIDPQNLLYTKIKDDYINIPEGSKCKETSGLASSRFPMNFR